MTEYHGPIAGFELELHPLDDISQAINTVLENVPEEIAYAGSYLLHVRRIQDRVKIGGNFYDTEIETTRQDGVTTFRVARSPIDKLEGKDREYKWDLFSDEAVEIVRPFHTGWFGKKKPEEPIIRTGMFDSVAKRRINKVVKAAAKLRGVNHDSEA